MKVPPPVDPPGSSLTVSHNATTALSEKPQSDLLYQALRKEWTKTSFNLNMTAPFNIQLLMFVGSDSLPHLLKQFTKTLKYFLFKPVL